MSPRSIKTRIALVTTVFIVAVVVVVLVAVFLVMRNQDVESIKDRLYATSAEACMQIGVEDGEVLGDVDAFVGENSFTAVYAPDGSFLCGFMPEAELDDVVFAPGQLRAEGEWLIFDTTFDLSGYGTVKVRSVGSIESAGMSYNRFLMVAIVGVVVIAFVCALGMLCIMRRALRPLDVISQTSGNISEGSDLSQRIRLEGSGAEFQRLASIFNAMLERLEGSFERERKFVNNASHELRTPVAVILSEADYALSDDADAPAQRDSLEKIRESAIYLSRLSNQLLSLARAQDGELAGSCEDVDLSELTNMVCDVMQDLAQEKGVRVERDIEMGIVAFVDETSLMRVQLNLVENAIKYGKEGGHVLVKLHREGSQVVCQVQDDGIGISREHLPHIWERFYQVDSSRSTQKASAGLGLHMVKLIVESHGGSITCSSALGRGSTFVWALPLRPLPQKALEQGSDD